MLAVSAGAQTPATTNVVVEEDNGTKTVFAAADIKNIVFEEMPVYVALPTLVDAIYTPAANAGMYELTIATAVPDAAGNPRNVGDIVVTTTLTAPLSDDRRNALLPDGYYRMGNGNTMFTFDASKTAIYARTAEGNDGVTVQPCISGTIDVKYIDSKYDIRMELITFDGSTYNVSYEGDLPFQLSSAGYEGFSKDVDITFEGCQGRFYGNWFLPFVDDMTLQLYTGDFNADGAQINGYWYNVYVNMPKVTYGLGETPKLVDGVYRLDTRKNIAYSSYLPFTCQIGQTIEAFGMVMNVGTVLTYTDPEGDNRVGLAESGTMTVSEGGTKIEIDFYTAEGVRIGGSFEGAPDIYNFGNNSNAPQRPYSTLTSDRTAEFVNTTVAIYFKEFPIVDTLGAYTLWLTDVKQETGDYFQFTYISEEGTGLANGTYTIGIPAKPFDLLPGELDYGMQPTFSWFANLEHVDADGVQIYQAPLTGGTMTVADASQEGYKTFTLDFTDDAGHKISGTVTLPVFDGDEIYGTASKKLIRR